MNAANRFQIQRLGITPMIGVTWSSSNFNDYYYGISAAESARSGLEEYEADSSVTPYARMVFDYSFNDHLSIWLEGSVRHLGSEVKDSPMVEDSVRLDLLVFFQKREISVRRRLRFVRKPRATELQALRARRLLHRAGA